jgi:hypothetical protein
MEEEDQIEKLWYTILQGWDEQSRAVDLHLEASNREAELFWNMTFTLSSTQPSQLF